MSLVKVNIKDILGLSEKLSITTKIKNQTNYFFARHFDLETRRVT